MCIRDSFYAIQTQLQRLATLSKIYSIDKPFTGLIKEALRLTGLDISAAVVAPAIAPDAVMRQRLFDILKQAKVIPA